MNNQIELERKFRPEIEGLRIVAALLVAVYHIWFNRISGGVDVFFVISGFLITTSIISRYNRTGEFKFFPYIFNLLKRLLPSIIVVVFTTAIISVFLLPKSIIEKTFNEAVASLLYYQNWQLAISNTDYLDQEQMSTPFEHFWAMSIQGQFYIVWFLLFTVIFFILRKNNINGIKIVNIFLISLFALSFSYSVYLTEVNQPWAYFDVGTRVWEFSLGGLLAVNLTRIKIKSLFGDIIGWAGLIGLLLTGVVFDVSTMFPGYVALWPMLCASVILLSGNINSKYGVKSFLGSKWMMKAGSYAFGLYLWHWVLLSFYQYHFEGNPDLFVGLSIIIVSFVLSWLMTEFIETPIRSMDLGKKSITVLSSGLIFTLLLIVGLYFSHQSTITDIDGEHIIDGHPGALVIADDVRVEQKEFIPSFAQAKENLADIYDDGYVSARSSEKLRIGEYGVLEDFDYTIALVGSSYSAHWLGALQQFAEEENIRILTMIQVSSRFSTEHEAGTPQRIWNDKAISYLHENKQDIDLVVSTSDIGVAELPEPPEGMAEQLNIIGDEVGLPVMAIRGNQRFGFNIVEHLEQYGYESTKEEMMNVEPISNTHPWDLVEYKSSNIHPVDYTEYFKVNGEYEPVIGNVLIYYDGGHINNTYSRTLGPVLQEDVMHIIKDHN